LDQDGYDDFCDAIDDAQKNNNDFKSLAGRMVNPPDPYAEILNSVIFSDLEMDSDVSSGNKFFVGDVSNDNKLLFKEIQVSNQSSNFSLITVNRLREKKGEDFRVIENIWAAIANTPKDKDEFWTLYTGQVDCSKFIITTDVSLVSDDDKWNAYSYAYLLYANKSGFDRNPQLDFDKQAEMSPQGDIQFQPMKEYSQYFEIFPLLSESHHCDNILSRYLNMYHIIEYMCYRRYIVEISSDRDMHQNKFVRRTIAKVSAAKIREKEEVVEGINKLFPSLNTKITFGNFTNKQITYIKNEYNIEVKNALSGKVIAEIIYAIRCSIVHNKATELHFSFENVSDYEDIIDVIKKLIKEIEPLIIELINKVDGNHQLEFKNKSINLY
jgi:hypothetical protein